MPENPFRTWQTFRRLGRPEKRAVLQAAAALALAWAGLRLTDFRRTQKALTWLNAPPGKNEPEKGEREKKGAGTACALDTALIIAKAEAAAARHMFFRPNCLENSLALWALLRHHGIHADLRLGARKEAGRFDAHAWVEYGGLALGDWPGELGKYTPFDGLPAPMETRRH